MEIVRTFSTLVCIVALSACCGGGNSDYKQPPAPGSSTGTSTGNPSGSGGSMTTNPPAQNPDPATTLKPESCNVSSFTKASKVTTSIYDPPRGEFDFAYNEGYFALAIASWGTWGSEMNVTILDKDGKQTGSYAANAGRTEFDPNIVAAPWGGFLVCYKFDKDGDMQNVRIACRTMGYNGSWDGKGFLASSDATDYGIRLRNLDDKIGLWYEEYKPNGDPKKKYLDVVDNKKQKAPLPAMAIPPLYNKEWIGQLKDTDGWPLTQGKGIRVHWAGDRFGVLARKKFNHGEEVKFMFFLALCE